MKSREERAVAYHLLMKEFEAVDMEYRTCLHKVGDTFLPAGLKTDFMDLLLGQRVECERLIAALRIKTPDPEWVEPQFKRAPCKAEDMTRQDFKAVRESLGMSTEDWGMLLGYVSDPGAAVRAIENGRIVIPVATAKRALSFYRGDVPKAKKPKKPD